MNIKQRIDRFFRRHYVTKKLSAVNIPFCTTRETLDACRIYIEQEKPGAFLRFGDGDVWIANGKEDMLQEQNHRMTLEMIEAFSLTGMGILKTLPLNSYRFGYEDGMSTDVHLMDDETVEKIISSTFEYFVGSIIYNTVALHHIATVDTQYCIEFLKILKEKTILLVGSELVNNRIKNILFGNVQHIKCPSKNSYKAIDEVCDEFKNTMSSLKYGHGVIVVAMGCAGRIFMKRMICDNEYNRYFYFDFGSMLDVFCGLNTRAWIEKTDISNKSRFILDVLSSEE